MDSPLVKALFLTAVLAAMPANAAAGKIENPPYNIMQKTQQMAFEPDRFFEYSISPPLLIKIIYQSYEYRFPIYSIAVRKGCTIEDTGEARKSCENRMIARMVRPPFKEISAYPLRGADLIEDLAQKNVQNDAELAAALDFAKPEWLEADINQCQPALDHLRTASEIPFFIDNSDNEKQEDIDLHPDTAIEFTYNWSDLISANYNGWIKRGSAGEWANNFAASLESCWKPAQTPPPWSKPL